MSMFHFAKDNSIKGLDLFPEFLRNPVLRSGFSSSESARSIRRALPITSQPNKSGKVTKGFLEALCRALKIALNPTCQDGFGWNGEETYVAEYSVPAVPASVNNDWSAPDVAGRRLFIGIKVTHEKNDAQLERASISCSWAGNTAVDLRAEKIYSGPFIFALWGLFLQDSEFNNAWTKLLAILKKNPSGKDEPDADDAVMKMADVAYFMTSKKFSSAKDRRFVFVDDPSGAGTDKVLLLTTNEMQSELYSPTGHMGNFTCFSTVRSNTKPSSKSEAEKNTDKDLRGKYSRRKLSAEEQAMFDSLPVDGHTLSDEAIRCIALIDGTRKKPIPLRNILLRGPAGTGKTQCAKDIALALGLPYVFVTCNSDTEIFDLLGQMIPNEETADHIPSVTEMYMEPERSYEAITGTYTKGVTEDDCLKALLKEGKKGGFHYVESPLVKAMRYGWVVEIQEPTVISKPGVLVGLNSLLDTGNAVTLPTGELVHRHPDTVVIATTNLSYAGCGDINQSVLSRFQVKMDMLLPPKDVCANRVRQMSGCAKNVKVERMVDAMNKIRSICNNNFLTDGSVDLRCVAAWASVYTIVKDYRLAAEMTIIPSATSDPDGIKKVREAIQGLF